MNKGKVIIGGVSKNIDTQGRIEGITCRIGDYLITLSISPFLTDSTVRISARYTDSFMKPNYYSTR